MHALGNPHYWLDPENGRRIARLFQRRSSSSSIPTNAAAYDANDAAPSRRGSTRPRQEWQPQLATIKGKPVVAWHTSWRYFAEYTGMNIVGFMEPKPGRAAVAVAPGQVIQTMQAHRARRSIIMEPFYDRKIADLVAKQTGAQGADPAAFGRRRRRRSTTTSQLMKYDIDAARRRA